MNTTIDTQDTVTLRKSPARKMAIAQAAFEFVTEFPELNHISLLSSPYAANWAVSTMVKTLAGMGVPFQPQVPGTRYQVSAVIADFCTTQESGRVIAMLAKLAEIRRISNDPNLAFDVQESSEEVYQPTPETEGSDLV